MSFVHETTLSGKSLLRQLERMKAEGYRVVITFVYLASADENVARLRERVRKGGHNDPEEDIRRRYLRSKSNFWHAYKSVADDWQLYYKGDKGHELVAYGNQNQVSIVRSTLFEAFLLDLGDKTDAQ